MPRTTNPLSRQEIESAKPKQNPYMLCDGQGLHLRIHPSGSKIWQFCYYKPTSKKRTTINIGPYPAVSLLKARRKHDKACEMLAKHIDPKGQI